MSLSTVRDALRTVVRASLARSGLLSSADEATPAFRLITAIWWATTSFSRIPPRGSRVVGMHPVFRVSATPGSSRRMTAAYRERGMRMSVEG